MHIGIAHENWLSSTEANKHPHSGINVNIALKS